MLRQRLFRERWRHRVVVAPANSRTRQVSGVKPQLWLSRGKSYNRTNCTTALHCGARKLWRLSKSGGPKPTGLSSRQSFFQGRKCGKSSAAFLRRRPETGYHSSVTNLSQRNFSRKIFLTDIFAGTQTIVAATRHRSPLHKSLHSYEGAYCINGYAAPLGAQTVTALSFRTVEDEVAFFTLSVRANAVVVEATKAAPSMNSLGWAQSFPNDLAR